MGERRFHDGDKVEWRSHGNTVRGTVEGEITSDTETAGRTVRASEDEPQYRSAATSRVRTPCTSRARCARSTRAATRRSPDQTVRETARLRR